MNTTVERLNIKKFVIIAYILIYPYLLFYLLEMMSLRNSSPSAILKYNCSSFFISGTILLLLILSLFFLTKKVFISGLIISIILAIFYTLNYYVTYTTGEVLHIEDFNLVTQFNNVLSFTNLNLSTSQLRSYLGMSLCLLLLGLASNYLKKTDHILEKVSKKIRCISFLLSIFVIIIVCFTNFSLNHILPRLNITFDANLSTEQTYDRHGALLGFYLTSFSKTTREPEDYSEEYMQKIVSTIKDDLDFTYKNDHIQPNIIVIMSEAFADPNLWNGIKLSSDPISHFHELSNSFTSGNLIAPVFGGGTCNSEYEFLTGTITGAFDSYRRVYLMEDTFIPSVDERALPNLLRKNGYETIAIHPYLSDFYNRNSIYPKLGFDHFISIEEMEDVTIKGEFASDQFLSEEIIKLIENNQENPLFIFAVSMQNHTDFTPNRYDTYDVTAKSDLLTENQQDNLDTYLQGLYDADQALNFLISHLENTSQPTIVILFGDHLPLLSGNSFEFYDAINYISSSEKQYWNLQDYYKMHSTPYLLWNNYDLEKQNWEDISPYFLSAELLNVANIQTNLHYAMLQQAHEAFNAYTFNLFIDKNNQPHSNVRGKEALTYYEMLKAFQYDYIYGKQYALNDMKQLITE